MVEKTEGEGWLSQPYTECKRVNESAVCSIQVSGIV